MKMPRSNRRNIFAYYAITTDVKLSSQLATMHNISKSGALLKVFGDLMLEEHIFARPLKNEESDNLPSPDEIIDHPEVIRGTVVRKEGADSYGIQFDEPLQEKKPASNLTRIPSKQTGWELEQDGYMGIFQINNTPDIPRLVRFRDTLKEYSQSCLHMLLDFTHSGKLPTMGYAILGEMLEDLAETNHLVALVEDQVFSESFLKKFHYTSQITFFNQREKALNYLKKHKVKVMVVEDEESTLHLIKRYLEKKGFNVFSYTDAENALTKIEKNQPDLILMDVHLPGINGLEATKQIRTRHSNQKIPIIILSGESNREIVSESIRLHVNGYLLKPLDSHNLAQKIIDILIQPT